MDFEQIVPAIALLLVLILILPSFLSSNSDLKILNATGSCGWTVPEYPRDTPIKPGESGTIKVKFDSSNKPGMQRKTVTLTTNTSKGKELLNIKAFVLPKE